jgi:hypothetical protein
LKELKRYGTHGARRKKQKARAHILKTWLADCFIIDYCSLSFRRDGRGEKRRNKTGKDTD